MKTKFAIVYFLIFSFFLVFAQSSSPVVKKIQTVSELNSITIKWELPDSVNDIVEFNIYRSNQSFTKPSQFNSNSFVTKVNKKLTSYKDSELQNKPYYYAVIAKLSNGKLFDVLIPSENVTIFPTSPLIPEAQNSNALKTNESAVKGLKEGSLRETPLPYLRLIEQDANTENNFSSSDNEFFKRSNKITDFYVFEEDQNELATGDDYTLHTIVNNYALVKNYEKAKSELTNMLNIKHDDNVTSRIYFYLGECAFFETDYKSALNYFLLAEKVYPYVSKKWQQYTIDAFQLPNTSK